MQARPSPRRPLVSWIDDGGSMPVPDGRMHGIRSIHFLLGKSGAGPNRPFAAINRRASRHPPIDARGGSRCCRSCRSQTPRAGTDMTAQIEAVDFFAFDNSYARLPDQFFARLPPTPVTAPRLPRSLSAAELRLGKISGIGSVNRLRCRHARARGRRQFQRALRPTDLHRPAGRRCGCWPTSTFLFRGIVVGRFGGGRWSSGDRRRCCRRLRLIGRRRWCRRRSSAASCRVIDNRSENLQHCQCGALPRSLSAAELRLGKISGIWQR